MRGLNRSLATAIAAIDAANAADPTVVSVRGESLPLALAHGRLAVGWVTFLRPDAPDTLLLAARAHHLRRWEVPRASYPEGRAAYLKWRKDQKARHARDVAEILVEAGFPPADIARVQALVRREQLATDPETQTLEDAACLVFIETQLGDVAARLEHGHLLEVIRKTARKMTPRGLAATAALPISDADRALLAEALATPTNSSS